jgi:hypothetical protein
MPTMNDLAMRLMTVAVTPPPAERAMTWTVGGMTTLASMLGGDSLAEVLIKGGIGGGICVICILLVRASIAWVGEGRADTRRANDRLADAYEKELAHEKRINADLVERIRQLESERARILRGDDDASHN